MHDGSSWTNQCSCHRATLWETSVLHFLVVVSHTYAIFRWSHRMTSLVPDGTGPVESRAIVLENLVWCIRWVTVWKHRLPMAVFYPRLPQKGAVEIVFTCPLPLIAGPGTSLRLSLRKSIAPKHIYTHTHEHWHPNHVNLVDGSSICPRNVGNTAHIHTVQRSNIRKRKSSALFSLQLILMCFCCIYSWTIVVNMIIALIYRLLFCKCDVHK
jgi:hypothetical protein